MRQKQVDKVHYSFSRYVHRRRWMSLWHQLDEIVSLNPDAVLEVGPGPGLFKAVALALGIKVETLDVDPDLNPDYVASATDMPLQDNTYDVACAFQVLEHFPFDESLKAFSEMARVSRRKVVVSLPDAKVRWPISIYIPMLGPFFILVPMPRLGLKRHKFNGEHHWEVNTAGYSLTEVVSAIESTSNLTLERTYRVKEFPFHRFFVFATRN